MELIEKIVPKAFFDIGARDGESAVAVKRQLPACRTYAFEANPHLYKQFAAKHAAEGYIDYRNLAIADHSGALDLYVPCRSSEVVIGDEIVKMRVRRGVGHWTQFSLEENRSRCDLRDPTGQRRSP